MKLFAVIFATLSLGGRLDFVFGGGRNLRSDPTIVVPAGTSLRGTLVKTSPGIELSDKRGNEGSALAESVAAAAAAADSPVPHESEPAAHGPERGMLTVPTLQRSGLRTEVSSTKDNIPHALEKNNDAHPILSAAYSKSNHLDSAAAGDKDFDWHAQHRALETRNKTVCKYNWKLHRRVCRTVTVTVKSNFTNCTNSSLPHAGEDESNHTETSNHPSSSNTNSSEHHEDSSNHTNCSSTFPNLFCHRDNNNHTSDANHTWSNNSSEPEDRHGNYTFFANCTNYTTCTDSQEHHDDNSTRSFSEESYNRTKNNCTSTTNSSEHEDHNQTYPSSHEHDDNHGNYSTTNNYTSTHSSEHEQEHEQEHGHEENNHDRTRRVKLNQPVDNSELSADSEDEESPHSPDTTTTTTNAGDSDHDLGNETEDSPAENPESNPTPSDSADDASTDSSDNSD